MQFVHEKDREWLAENGFIKWRDNKWNEYYTKAIGRMVVTVAVPWSPNWGCFAFLSIRTDGYKPIESSNRGTAKDVVHDVISQIETMMNDISEIREFLKGEKKDDHRERAEQVL